jgi:hypothetical protein
MSIGVFCDKHSEPSLPEINITVGPRLPLWDELIGTIRERYTPLEDLKFLYGKEYGWGIRFRMKGQLLTSLYPTEGGFTVQINLNPADIDTALGMQPGKNVQQAIARANPYPEGRWLFIPVESSADLEDIYRLLELRVKSKRLG